MLFTKDEACNLQEKEVSMKRVMMFGLCLLISLLEDILFYVLGDGEEEIGILISTKWCNHWY